jgi:ABC-2 type transport system ATP-binding protein
MYDVEVNNVTKKYSDRTVVDNVSFTVSGNEILGLIGPNGAGKTTTIRMVMDVIKPDSGTVLVYGQRFNDDLKDRIGYLPEERGLYRKLHIIDSMVYLGTLKGMSTQQAKQRAEYWLTRVDFQKYRNRKIEELSHGMAQIVQILVAVLHDPQVIILDEPFNGLDPVNVKMVKDMILELKSQGKAVMLSTHRMNEVEELCSRILMINKGKNVLYGDIDEIKQKYRSDSVLVDYEGDLGSLDGLEIKPVKNHTVEIHTLGKLTHQQLLEFLISRKITINKFEVATPSLNDIFIQVAGAEK